MEKDYSKVYKELYEIFKYLSKEQIEKVPKEFIDVVNSKKDDEYSYKVEHIKDFENQEMMRETRAILAVLYRDYWCSEEERKEILRKEKEEYIKEENEKKEKYDYDLFKELRKEKQEEPEEKEIVVYKESFLKKILKMIKKLFK